MSEMRQERGQMGKLMGYYRNQDRIKQFTHAGVHLQIKENRRVSLTTV